MRFPPEEAACPYCRTPRQDAEAEPLSPLESPVDAAPIMPAPRLGLYLMKAGAAFIGFLALAWCLHRLFPATLESSWTDFQNEVERARDPHPRAAAASVSAEVTTSSYVYLSGSPPPTTLSTSFTPRAEPPPAARAPSDPPPPPAERPSPAGSPATDPAPVTAKTVVEAAPAPPLPDPSFFRVYGVVYDLATLRPIVGAHLVFRTAHFTVAAGVTDAAGHYRVDLSKGNNSGDVTISILEGVPGYRNGLFEDKDPPLRERPKEARLMIMSETTDSDLEPVPLRYKQSDEVIPLDLVLVPLAKK